ncbi:radical SAM protein [Lentisphaerota bacterium ZTH]|nr:B12-binding domain-containing radical SAM protein [Lentisphaerota bacterium]WET07482.1 radical SAM protein [Lentisphaerota bacterium ZTH]
MSSLNDISEFNPNRKKIFRMIIPCYPAFNIYSSVARKTTALGPIMIATVVSKIPGWEVEVIDENNYCWCGPQNAEGKPAHCLLQQSRAADVVGLYGGLTSTIPRLYEIASFYRKHGVINICGGQHFIEDNIREALNNNIDYVVVGEGEVTIRELFEALCTNKDVESIDGIAFRSDGNIIVTQQRKPIEDLSNLPLPDFSLLRYAKVSLYPVSWTRGCGMNCEFCTVKGKVRCGTVDYAFQQFTSIFERFNGKSFFIVDDLFGQKRELTIELCRRLKAYQELIGVRFFISVQIRLDKANDSELLSVMRDAGVKVVAIGFESPVSSELEAMDKRLNSKEMINLTNIFHRTGFRVHGMFIFGYPAKVDQKFTLSARERVKLFYSFIRKARIDTIQVVLPVPLPGTELTRRLEAAKRIFPKESIGWEYYDGNFPLFFPDEPLTAQDMYLSHKLLMTRFYRFRYFFAMILNIIIFPMIIFSIFNLRRGWNWWYRAWRNNLWRIVGWSIIRKWSACSKKDGFGEKLAFVEHQNRQ